MKLRKELDVCAHGIFWFFSLTFLFPCAGFVVLVSVVYNFFLVWPLRMTHWIMRPSRNVLAEKKNEDAKIKTNELAIVITGCDTGFGKSYAFELAKKKQFVIFAGCLTDKGVRQYNDIPNIIPFRLDITQDKDVTYMKNMISLWLKGVDEPLLPNTATEIKKRRWLYALIHNAGMGSNGPIDWTPVSDFERVMNINYFGTVRVVKAFLPVFRFQRPQGAIITPRIVLMGSFGGHVPFPGSPAYVISKHAVEGFAASLRCELYGDQDIVKVVTINPSVHNTTMIDHSAPFFEAKWRNLDSSVRREYGQACYDVWHKTITKDAKAIAWDAKNVVKILIRCIEDQHPTIENMVGMDAKYILIFLKMVPASIQTKLLTTVSPLNICEKMNEIKLKKM